MVNEACLRTALRTLRGIVAGIIGTIIVLYAPIDTGYKVYLIPLIFGALLGLGKGLRDKLETKLLW